MKKSPLDRAYARAVGAKKDDAVELHVIQLNDRDWTVVRKIGTAFVTSQDFWQQQMPTSTK